MTNQNSEPAEAPADVTSDPARDDSTGSDWATEGGATEEGPATDTDQQSAARDPEQVDSGA